MASSGRKLSVIVPTFREASNVRQLCERLTRAFREAKVNHELIFVDDDSCDGIVEIVAELADQYPVRVIVRDGPRDLSGAVMDGFAAARHDCLLVMDADLQHLPEQAPSVAHPILDGRADICVGSRYVTSASSSSDWPARRKINSLAATALARPLTPVRDCMAGFFALRREMVADCSRLRPVGYKILLEILAKSPAARVVEVPIDFSTRHAGESKLNVWEKLRYVQHLFRLYRERWPVGFVLFVLMVFGSIAGIVWWCSSA